MGDNTGSLILVGFLGIFVAAIGLGFYQTYAMLSIARTNPDAASRLATGVAVGTAATGIGYGIGAANGNESGGRRKTGRKRKGKKTYRKTK